MDDLDLLSLPLAVQTALGAGYLAYVIAYGGIRQHHTAQDAVFLTLAFGILPGSILAFSTPSQLAPGLLLAVASAVLLGATWRRWGRDLAASILRGAQVHRDDGLHAAWDGLIQTTRPVTQISVHMKDGRVLHCNDTKPYEDAYRGGLYLGGDGAVVMVVEEEEVVGPDGAVRTEVREDIVVPGWGTRLTYIPAGEVARVNIRYP